MKELQPTLFDLPSRRTRSYSVNLNSDNGTREGDGVIHVNLLSRRPIRTFTDRIKSEGSSATIMMYTADASEINALQGMLAPTLSSNLSIPLLTPPQAPLPNLDVADRTVYSVVELILSSTAKDARAAILHGGARTEVAHKISTCGGRHDDCPVLCCNHAMRSQEVSKSLLRYMAALDIFHVLGIACMLKCNAAGDTPWYT